MWLSCLLEDKGTLTPLQHTYCRGHLQAPRLQSCLSPPGRMLGQDMTPLAPRGSSGGAPRTPLHSLLWHPIPLQLSNGGEPEGNELESRT